MCLLNFRNSQVEHGEIQRIATVVALRTKVRPKLGIICGSGLGGIADQLDGVTREVIPYEEIDGFPECTGKSDFKKCIVKGSCFDIL